ncbi:MAG: VOC family protein [Beijerinckiaceae bacterium]
MYSHTTVGTGNLEKARGFYDAVLPLLGIHLFHDESAHGWLGYSKAVNTTPGFWIGRPLDGKAPSVGNGVTVAFEAKDRETVRKFYAAAMAAGGTSEGEPGIRAHYHPDYYGTYVRDLDGHKICCVCHLPE